MFYTEFDDLLPEGFRQVDLYPKKLRNLIDEANEWIYNDINNGVYKSGFATWGSEILSSSHLPLDPNKISEHRKPMRMQSSACSLPSITSKLI